MAKTPSKEQIENTLVQVSKALKDASAVQIPKAVKATDNLDNEPVMQQVQQAAQTAPSVAPVQQNVKQRARTPVRESRGIAMGSFK